MELVGSSADSGTRLDRFVSRHCPELSRSRVQELIDGGLVRVDGRAAKSSLKLRGGERITVEAQPRPRLQAQPESIPLTVLFEDPDLLIVNKPAGMTVHAGAGHSSGTLVNALLGRGQALSTGNDELRPGIVHRLDRDTSGVIVVAKNDFAHARLSEAFRTRAVRKTYIALVHGRFDTAQGSIRLAIGRDPKNRMRMSARRMSADRSREARTDWRTLAEPLATTLLEIQLHTGRTHQIRVHFSAMKHPVVGDRLYGAPAEIGAGKNAVATLERQFLHAARIGFRHPRTGVALEARAPLAPDLSAFLEGLAAAGEAPGRIDAALKGYL